MVRATSHEILVLIRGLGGGLRSPSEDLRCPSASGFPFIFLIFSPLSFSFAKV